VGQTQRSHARIIAILCFAVYPASGLLLMYLLCPPNWESVLERLSRLLSRFSLFANEACAKSLRARITQLVLEYTRTHTQTHGATHAPTQWQLSHSLFFPFLYMPLANLHSASFLATAAAALGVSPAEYTAERCVCIDVYAN
jgi:hypothetical protein